MKILKRGAVPDPVRQVTCRHCNSELEFNESEARVHFDRNEACLIVKCPVCSREVWTKK